MCKMWPNIVQTSSGKKWMVNLGAVLGEMSTSGGLTQLNSTLALTVVPGKQKRMYTDTEVSQERNALTSYTINAGSG